MQNAVDQAKVAAASLLDRNEPYAAVPWFWSDQYDLKLQIVGLSAGYDRVVPRRAYLRVLQRGLLPGGRLLACDSVNRPADFVAVRKALATGANFPATLVADEDVALNTLLAAAG